MTRFHLFLLLDVMLALGTTAVLASTGQWVALGAFFIGYLNAALTWRAWSR